MSIIDIIQSCRTLSLDDKQIFINAVNTNSYALLTTASIFSKEGISSSIGDYNIFLL